MLLGPELFIGRMSVNQTRKQFHRGFRDNVRLPHMCGDWFRIASTHCVELNGSATVIQWPARDSRLEISGDVRERHGTESVSA